MIVLRYVGDGACWVPGVPARDLTDEDLVALEATYTAARLARYRPIVYELVIEPATVEIVPIERVNLRGIVKIT